MDVKCCVDRETASRVLFSNCSMVSFQVKQAADKLKLVFWGWISQVKVTILTLKIRGCWLHERTPPPLPLCCFIGSLLSFDSIGGNNFYRSWGMFEMFFSSIWTCWYKVMHLNITAWYTLALHPALQMDWGEGMVNIWILLLSSVLLLFSYLKVFYQYRQVHGEL